jgi:hypothetical protein
MDFWQVVLSSLKEILIFGGIGIVVVTGAVITACKIIKSHRDEKDSANRVSPNAVSVKEKVKDNSKSKDDETVRTEKFVVDNKCFKADLSNQKLISKLKEIGNNNNYAMTDDNAVDVKVATNNESQKNYSIKTSEAMARVALASLILDSYVGTNQNDFPITISGIPGPKDIVCEDRESLQKTLDFELFAFKNSDPKFYKACDLDNSFTKTDATQTTSTTSKELGNDGK